MFKFFRNETGPKIDAKVQWAQDAAYSLLTLQLKLGGALDDSAAKQRLFPPHGSGYVFGFADALLQRAGLTDEVATMAALVVTYVRIFGKDQGPKIFRAALDLQSDTNFTAGRIAGANEALQWLAAPEKSAAMGLADYLNARRR
jgi:hypothetical protein